MTPPIRLDFCAAAKVLLIRIKTIFLPFTRISFYVVPDSLIFRLIPDHMIMKRCLPYFHARVKNPNLLRDISFILTDDNG